MDLTPIEDARAIRRRMEAEEWNFVQASDGLGRPPSTLRDRVKLLDLIPQMLQLLERDEKRVSFGVAMIKLDPDAQFKAFDYLIETLRRARMWQLSRATATIFTRASSSHPCSLWRL